MFQVVVIMLWNCKGKLRRKFPIAELKNSLKVHVEKNPQHMRKDSTISVLLYASCGLKQLEISSLQDAEKFVIYLACFSQLVLWRKKRGDLSFRQEATTFVIGRIFFTLKLNDYAIKRKEMRTM